MNGLPAVELTLVIRGNKVAGEIVFPFHQRTPEGKWVVIRRDATPILNPRLQGNSLSFEVAHHKSHGSSEWGPNVPFRVDLKSPDEARLFKLDETSPSPGPGLLLSRRKNKSVN